MLTSKVFHINIENICIDNNCCLFKYSALASNCDGKCNYRQKEAIQITFNEQMKILTKDAIQVIIIIFKKEMI